MSKPDGGWVTAENCASMDEFTKGLKEVSGKNPYELIPPEIFRGLVEIFKYGAGKYGEHNWEKGIHTRHLYAAMLRHTIEGWMSGEMYDKESGLLHSAHAAWMACAIMFFHMRDLPIRNPDS